MTLLEDLTAVFIVRVWCERGDTDAAKRSAISEWRGSVEHVQSGQRNFFRNLEAICDFMKPHLENIGIDAQQRFWERISSVVEDIAPTPDAPELISISTSSRSIPSQPVPLLTARKRR